MITLHFDPAPLLAIIGAPLHCPSPKAENVAMRLAAPMFVAELLGLIANTQC